MCLQLNGLYQLLRHRPAHSHSIVYKEEVSRGKGQENEGKLREGTSEAVLLLLEFAGRAIRMGQENEQVVS